MAATHPADGVGEEDLDLAASPGAGAPGGMAANPAASQPANGPEDMGAFTPCAGAVVMPEDCD